MSIFDIYIDLEHLNIDIQSLYEGHHDCIETVPYCGKKWHALCAVGWFKSDTGYYNKNICKYHVPSTMAGTW